VWLSHRRYRLSIDARSCSDDDVTEMPPADCRSSGCHSNNSSNNLWASLFCFQVLSWRLICVVYSVTLTRREGGRRHKAFGLNAKAYVWGSRVYFRVCMVRPIHWVLFFGRPCAKHCKLVCCVLQKICRLMLKKITSNNLAYNLNVRPMWQNLCHSIT